MKYIFFNHPVIYSINDASSPRRIETIMNTGILISGVDYDRLVGFHPTLKIRSKSNPNQREHVSPQFLCAPLLRESAHVCRNRIRKRGRPNSAWRACGSHDGPRDWMSKSELHNAWVTGTRRFSCRDRWESNAISCLEKKRKKKRKEREERISLEGIFFRILLIDMVNMIGGSMIDEIVRKQELHDYGSLKVLNKYFSWIFSKFLEFYYLL